LATLLRIAALDHVHADGFRLHVPELLLTAGEAVALSGPSGCGKTTLLELIAGIRRPTGGSVQVLGAEPMNLDETARRRFRLVRLGLIFQDLELVGDLDLIDNILLPCHLGAGDARAQRPQALALAEQLGLDRKLAHRPAQLSQGERQRVAIARALLRQPGLILADEPTSSLDRGNAERVLELLREQCRLRGAGLLLVSHDPAQTARCDRVLDATGWGRAP
jgi:putative ABC transport system ATP-binding protein